MTQQTQSEAHSAAEETRELWRNYLSVSHDLINGSEFPIGHIGYADNVGRVVRLLREQHRILTEILGG